MALPAPPPARVRVPRARVHHFALPVRQVACPGADVGVAGGEGHGAGAVLGAGAEGARVGVAAEGDARAGAVGAAVEEGLGEVVRAEVVAGEVGGAEGGVGGQEGEVGYVVVCVGVVAQGFDGEVSVGGRGG